jgi:hypothetical protein
MNTSAIFVARARAIAIGTLYLDPATVGAEPSVEMIANTCVMCHGTNGKGPGSIEELYGMPAEEFIKERHPVCGLPPEPCAEPDTRGRRSTVRRLAAGLAFRASP